MSPDVVIVDLAGLALIAWIVWYLLLSRRSEEAVAAARAGVQDVEVTVKGGYSPDVILARPDVPLRIRFRREEDSPCSEEVVFPDFGIRRHLPAFETTVVEIPASPQGTYSFACGMNMMHGTLTVGERASASPPAPTAPAFPAGSPKAVDPVCGMTVDPARAAATSERDGRTVYFCSPGCKARFDAGDAPGPTEHRVHPSVSRKA